jgi:hypothetical protein
MMVTTENLDGPLDNGSEEKINYWSAMSLQVGKLSFLFGDGTGPLPTLLFAPNQGVPYYHMDNRQLPTDGQTYAHLCT